MAILTSVPPTSCDCSMHFQFPKHFFVNWHQIMGTWRKPFPLHFLTSLFRLAWNDSTWTLFYDQRQGKTGWLLCLVSPLLLNCGLSVEQFLGIFVIRQEKVLSPKKTKTVLQSESRGSSTVGNINLRTIGFWANWQLEVLACGGERKPQFYGGEFYSPRKSVPSSVGIRCVTEELHWGPSELWRELSLQMVGAFHALGAAFSFCGLETVRCCRKCSFNNQPLECAPWDCEAACMPTRVGFSPGCSSLFSVLSANSTRGDPLLRK